MNSAVFVQTVRECAPPLEVLRKEGLSKKEALDFQKRNFAPKLDNSEVIQHQDPILDLLNNYDVSSLEVGMVSFVSPARLTALGTIVGNVEADLLVIAADGEIQVREFGAEHHVLWPCAATSAQFLDALAVVASFYNWIVDTGDQATANAYADRCARAAGGEMYIRFYWMLLGRE